MKPEFDDLVQSIYDASLNPEGWRQTLDDIRDYLQASAINLIGLEMAASRNPLVYSSNIPQDYGTQYQSHWFERDPWVAGAVRQNFTGGGLTLMGGMLASPTELVRSEFYHDWLRHQAIKDVLSTNLWGSEPHWGKAPDYPRMVLCFFRPPHAEDFDEQDRAKLARLSGHLNRAFQMAHRLGLLQRDSQVQQQVIDSLPQAVLLLDEQGRVVQANPAGDRVLAGQPGLVKIHQGRVVALGDQCSMDLKAAFSEAWRGVPAWLSFTYGLVSGSRRLGSARILRISHLEAFGLPGQQSFYLLMLDLGADDVNSPVYESFCKLFGLSKTEVRVLSGLIGNLTPDEIAAQQQVSVATVRTQIQSIRQKTGVRRIPELIRMATAIGRAAL